MKSVSRAVHWRSFPLPLFYWMTYGRGLITSLGNDRLDRHRYGVSAMDWQRIWRQSLYAVYRPGKWLWIDSSGKNGNRHPIEGYFGNEFSSIYNRRGVMTAWSRNWDGKKIIFTFFLKIDPLREIFLNSVPKGFIATPIDMLRSNFVKLGQREIGKIVCCLPDKKFRLALQLSLLRGSRPKSARVGYRQCTQSAPNFIEIG